MYENLRPTIDKALSDSEVIAAHGAMIYKSDDEFSYIPHNLVTYGKSNEFLLLEVEGEGKHCHAVMFCREAIQYQSYIIGILNNEIIETEGEQ